MGDANAQLSTANQTKTLCLLAGMVQLCTAAPISVEPRGVEWSKQAMLPLPLQQFSPSCVNHRPEWHTTLRHRPATGSKKGRN